MAPHSLDSTPQAPLVIIGAGGHAKVVIEVARSLGHDIYGCTGHAVHGNSVLGVPYLGNDETLSILASRGFNQVFVALGDNERREKAANYAESLGFKLATLVSPHAHVSPSARIDPGTLVMPGAIVNAAAVIKRLTIINTGASVDHDCVIEDAAHIAPGAHLSGGVRIGQRTLIGIGSAIIPQMTVGHDAVVGAGSVVVKPLSDNCLAYGNPAVPQNQTSPRTQ